MLSVSPIKRRAIHHAMAGLLLASSGVVISAAHAQDPVASPGQADAASKGSRRYDISAGSLTDAVNRLAAISAVYLAGSGELTQGKSSAGLHGTYTTQAAFSALLSGSGIEAVSSENGQFALSAVSNTADDRALPPVLVKGHGKNDTAGALNPPTTVGSKTAVSQRELSQSVTVIGQQQIQQQAFTSLDQTMKYVPGVTVMQSDADRVQYYARGFPISAFQVDGLPVFYSPNPSQTANSSTQNLAMYDRVEVLSGPAGLLDGLGGLGGVVNLVRKRAPSVFQASGTLTGGTDNNRGAELDVGGPLNAACTVRGLIVGSFQNRNLTGDATWQRDKSIYGTLEADVAPGTTVRVGASYSEKVAHDLWTNGPVPMTNGQFYRFSRSQYFGGDWNKDSYRSSDVFAELEHKLDNGWTFRMAADYQYDRNWILSNWLGQVDSDSNLGSFTTVNKGGYESKTNLEIYATGPVHLWGREHQITVGANYMKMSEQQTTLQGLTDGSAAPITGYQDINHYVLTKPAWDGAVSDTNKTHEYTTQYGVYGNARFKLLDPLTLVVGARATWYMDDSVPDPTYNLYQSKATYNHYTGKITPYAGLIYDINPTYSTYVSYTNIFSPNTGSYSSDGKILAPITGNQWELGVKGQYFDGRLNTSVAIYQITQENTPMTDPGNDLYAIATGKARVRGIELKASGEVLPGWDVFAGYTYNNSRYLNAGSDSYSYGFTEISPKHTFSVWTSYRLPGHFNQWQFGAGVVATSRVYSGQYDDAGDELTYTQKAYFIADARVAYQITKKESIAINVTNLFNKDYFQNANYRGAPREVMLTLRAAY